MLDFSETTNPNAIETLFCKPFHALVPKEDNMTLEDKKILLQVMQLPEDLDKQKGQTEMLNKIPIFASINNMLKNHFTVKLCFRTKFWLSHIVGEPSRAFAWLVYVQYRAKQLGKQYINFRTFCEHICPEGFPLKNDIDLLSAGTVTQKPDGTNALLFEFPKAMESIQFPYPIADVSQETLGSQEPFEIDDSDLLTQSKWAKKMEQKISIPKPEMPSLMQLIGKSSIFKK